MGQIGMGVMIQMLAGNEDSVKAIESATGKEIAKLAIEDDRLKFTFVDDSVMSLFDDGQSCCERRYMHTDDDLSHYVGATLQDAEVREGPSESGEYGDAKDSAFLIVTTSKGQFTVVNYNVHNGYYGGFAIRAFAG